MGARKRLFYMGFIGGAASKESHALLIDKQHINLFYNFQLPANLPATVSGTAIFDLKMVLGSIPYHHKIISGSFLFVAIWTLKNLA